MIIKYVATVSLMVLTCACDENIPNNDTIEANEQTCKKEFISKLQNRNDRERLAHKCFTAPRIEKTKRPKNILEYGQ
ncbi:entry exclusion lipoprotein TrbK [Lautropia mirabilis]